MAEGVLDTIAKLINSPPGYLVTGGVLWRGVWKSFELTENLLNDDTKRQIGIWLLGANRYLQGPIGRIQTWPETFANVFDRVFGEKHLSWMCFWRSAVASYSALFVIGMYLESFRWLVSLQSLYDTVRYGFVGNVLPDYLSLLETRYVMTRMQKTQSGLLRIILLVVDFILTSGIALITAHIILSLWWVNDDPRKWDWSPSGIWGHSADFHQVHSWISFVVPAFLTSIWLWLYAGSGFLLKAARRFDIGFEWFNRHFDIEKKPLQSIGFVAGALVAVLFWSAVILYRIVS
jgi:uncharacterized protein